MILCGHKLIQRRNFNNPGAAIPILNIKRANNRSMSCVKMVRNNTILLYTIVGRDQCNDNNNNNNNDDTNNKNSAIRKRCGDTYQSYLRLMGFE